MNDYRAIYSCIWADQKFVNLPSQAQMFFFYLITCQDSMNLCGIYEIDVDVCILKLKITHEIFDANIQKLAQKKMIEYDKETNVLWIINAFKRLPNANSSKVLAAVSKQLSYINHPFRTKFIEKYSHLLPDLKKELWRLPDFFTDFNAQERQDYFLKPENIIQFHKHYSERKDLKKFLMDRGCREKEIDEILPQVLPSLK